MPGTDGLVFVTACALHVPVMVLDPRIARYAWQEGEPAVLTKTEKAVARLVARGRSNAEIAGELYLAEGTVKNHVSALLRKLEAWDRTVLALRLAKVFGTT